MLRFLGIIAAGVLLALSLAGGADAQQVNNYWCTSSAVPCPPSGWTPTSAANPMPVSASVTASIAGYHPSSSLAPITATTGGVSSASFTAGQSILVQNVGSTNAAYCSPGNSATTSSQYIAPGSSALITTTSETAITCATSTSTTTVNFQVGTGLWTGAGGGGGGGGGGGTVTQGPGGASAWLVTGTGGTFPVTGTFWQTTQPVSVASPVQGTSTPTTAAPTAGTFSSLLAASGTRKACLIQNNSTSVGYIYPAATGGTTGNAFQVPANGGTFSCTNGFVTITDALTGTCATGTCAFVISAQ